MLIGSNSKQLSAVISKNLVSAPKVSSAPSHTAPPTNAVSMTLYQLIFQVGSKSGQS